MTANGKINLVVTNDGTVKPLLAKLNETNRSNWQKSDKTYRLIGCVFVFLFAVFGIFIGFRTISKHHTTQLEYNVYIVAENSLMEGKVGVSEKEAVSTFISENVVTLSDGFAHMTAVKINTSTPGLASSVCLVRNDEVYGMESPPILPQSDALDTLMKESISNQKVDMLMTEDVWVPDVYDAVDFEHLPLAVKSLCEGSTIYMMIPKEEDDDDDDDYDDETDEEYDDIETTTYSTYLNVREEYGYDDVVEDDDVTNEQDPSDNDHHQNEPKKQWSSRKKRGTSEEKEAVPENTDDKVEEERTDESNRFGVGQSDAELQCCNHCRRPYMQCSHVCVPIQQLTYPYFYRSCDYVQCSIMFPCVWWRARAAGYT